VEIAAALAIVLHTGMKEMAVTDNQRRWLFVVSAGIAGGSAPIAGGAIAFLVMWWFG
jgi:hypothetical protein